MNQQELDHLFSSARKAPTDTPIEEVTAWVGTAAAASVGVLGIAAKLKLFIAKKSLLMLGTIIGGAGLITTAALMLGSTPSSPEHNTTPVITYSDKPTEQQTEDTIYFTENEDNSETPVASTQQVETLPMSSISPMDVSPISVQPIEVDVQPSYFPPAGVSPTKTPSEPQGNKKRIKCKKVKGNGNVTVETLQLKSFSKLVVEGVFDVFIIQGNEEKAEVHTDENIQPYLTTKIVGETLTLDIQEGIVLRNPTKFDIYLTVKSLSLIDLEGVGDIIAKDLLNGNKMEINVSGVGDVKLNLDYTNLDIDYSGVGDVKLSGNANDVSCNYSGVGDLLAYDLNATNVTLTHSGVGDAKVFATEDLEVNFSGIGGVRYKGNPKNKTLNKSGIGSIKAR